MMPSRVTDDPTIPVAAAKIVAVAVTAKYRDPCTGAKSSWKALKSRFINPESSRIYPIKRKKGTAARTESIMT